MPQHTSPRCYGHVPAPKRAAASVVFCAQIVALLWDEARDIASRGDGHIPACGSADSTKIGCVHLVVRRAVLLESKPVIVSSCVHITGFCRHGDAPVLDSS